MKNAKKEQLKIMFFGGVGEIGKNLTALEYGGDILVIDCGSSFPTTEMPGVDLVIPDVSYLAANRDRVRGIVLTHGHEDHIGALPFVLKDLSVPVYGTRITLALVENKIREHMLEGVRLNVVESGSTVSLGCFGVEFVNVSHSIAGSCALCISTPVGCVYHSGDFKIDYTPVAGNMTDLGRIAKIGEKGVLLLLCESTNIERPGSSMSERKVADSFNTIFSGNSERRIVIATFASNIHRLQQILDIAAKYGRKVAFCGRSMLNVVQATRAIGELRFSDGQVVDIDRIKNIEDRNLVIITTGSQGEPMSALTRMASDEMKIKLGYNDTVVISATPIPGNERMIYTVINNLYRHGCRVIYESLAEVHVSGHAYQEEIKLLHSLIKPRFFVPVHGERRHQCRHAELAESMGMTAKNILIPEIGSQILLSGKKMTFGENVPAGNVLVDGLGVGDVGSTVLRDRKHMAEEGLVIVLVNIDRHSGRVSDVDITSRGFVYGEEGDNITAEARDVIVQAGEAFDLRGDGDLTSYKNQIRKSVRSFFTKKIRRNPMVIPIVIEV